MTWESGIWRTPEGATRAGSRWSGKFWSFVPFSLATPNWRISSRNALEAVRVERRARTLSSIESPSRIEALKTLLICIEAVASSRIEGVESDVEKILAEELIRFESDKSRNQFSDEYVPPQVEIVRNIAAQSEAVEQLGASERVTWEDVEALQKCLLPDFEFLGTRERQNWLGGSSYHPGNVEFIPPASQRLPNAIDDLLDFFNGAATGSLIRTALIHAQFLTLHPFADGNGRIGRALTQTALVRSGMTRGMVLPLSPILLAGSEEYVAGLMAYRGVVGHKDFTSDTQPERDLSLDDGVNAWLEYYISAADASIDLATQLGTKMEEFAEDARQRIADYAAQNSQREPRRDATVWKILEALPRLPVISVQAAAKVTSTSTESARNALEDLEKFGILRTRNIRKSQHTYVCEDLIEIMDKAERAWAIR